MADEEPNKPNALEELAEAALPAAKQIADVAAPVAKKYGISRDTLVFICAFVVAIGTGVNSYLTSRFPSRDEVAAAYVSKNEVSELKRAIETLNTNAAALAAAASNNLRDTETRLSAAIGRVEDRLDKHIAASPSK